MTPTLKRFPLATGITLAGDYYEPQLAPDAAPSAPAPLVLFLHGGGQTRHAWGGAAARLAEAGFPTLTVDHRGHGDSSWAEDGDYLFPRFADDLDALLPLLGEKPIIVGASLGGLSAMAVEARHPAAVSSGIVLVDVTPRLEREGVMRIIEFMQERKDGFASLDEVSAFVASFLPHRPKPQRSSGLEKNLRRGEDGRYRWHWDPQVLNAWTPGRYSDSEAQSLIEDRLEAAKRLDVPVLLVRGRMSDVVSEDSVREFLGCCPHAEYVDLEGAAHMVAGDKNDAFGEVVLDFVQRLRHK